MFSIKALFRQLSLAGLLFTSLAGAQETPLQTWQANSTNENCGIFTTIDMQDLPTGGFSLFSEQRNRFQILMNGNISGEGSPESAQVIFTGREAPVLDMQFIREPSDNSLLDDTFEFVIHLDTEYLQDVAESPSFLIRLDGNDFATFTLTERGQAVAYMARCMMAMKK